jgi:hypothetical protein
MGLSGIPYPPRNTSRNVFIATAVAVLPVGQSLWIAECGTRVTEAVAVMLATSGRIVLTCAANNRAKL